MAAKDVIRNVVEEPRPEDGSSHGLVGGVTTAMTSLIVVRTDGVGAEGGGDPEEECLLIGDAGAAVKEAFVDGEAVKVATEVGVAAEIGGVAGGEDGEQGAAFRVGQLGVTDGGGIGEGGSKV